MMDGDDYTYDRGTDTSTRVSFRQWQEDEGIAHEAQARDLRTADQKLEDELGDLRTKNYLLTCEVRVLRRRVESLEAAQ